MKPIFKAGRWAFVVLLLALLTIPAGNAGAQSGAPGQTTNDMRIVVAEGKIEILPAGTTRWVITGTNQVLKPHDHVRTGPNSRAVLRLSGQDEVPLNALTEVEILPPHENGAQSGLFLFKGILSFFHRDKPARLRVLTRGSVAGVEGTEFVMEVNSTNGTERTIVSVIDGKVALTNNQGSLLLMNGMQAIAEMGKAPVLTRGFIANNVLQWCFYYPAVLDLRDLPLSSEEKQTLQASLAAYRQGDLLEALRQYSEPRQSASDAERVYYGALLLSVGQVPQTETVLATLSVQNPSERLPRLATALRQLIAAVKRDPNASTLSSLPRQAGDQLSTELLAASYYEQSRAIGDETLRAALDLARQAATNSPEFGFAWERVAELEFSFGYTSKALEALNQSLALSPRNAQAIALKGFLLAARNKTREAIDIFNQAIGVDSALGNAWLGRGLSRIHLGDAIGGREDLLVAAALEPQRGLVRSYLGKAYANEGDYPRATKELELAKRLDPNDPTSWLYSALLKQQHNQINEAIRDLEKSEELNNNRSVYRSQLLLDQDRAVRSANLAGIYRDAGMLDVSVREASRAVNYDYANYSAHLFLADSFNQNLSLISRRYETATEAEFLIANLLAPAGAGTLSPALSQQEYSKLFERDRFGIVSTTEYFSRGAWLEDGVQYGTFGNFSYDFEGFYASDTGQRVNNDFKVRNLAVQIKQHLTPEDSVYLRASFLDSEEGDLVQYYDPKLPYFLGGPFPDLRIKEKQEPILSLGYHHEWSPGIHTLVLATRMDDKFSQANPVQPSLLVFKPGGTFDAVEGLTFNEKYEANLEVYSTELQQIWEQATHNTIIGARVQYGHFRNKNFQDHPSIQAAQFPDPPTPAADQDINSLFRRLTFYGYHQWRVVDSFQLTVGLSYDRVTFPENFRTAPLSENEKTVDQVSPKAGFIWTPALDTAIRFAYTRSIAGASLDQSFQLEPSQVAGFVQSFRSLIPESVAGPNAGATFETFGLSIEQKLATRTYLGISGEILNSQVSRTVGTFLSDIFQFDTAVPSFLHEDLDYHERSLLVTINQLLGENWSFGARYRLSHADLKDTFPGVPDGLRFEDFRRRQNLDSTLHQLNLFAIFNHRSGAFARLEGAWYDQSNRGYSPDRPGDEFWHWNAFAGYRFSGRRAEVSVGVLNLAGQDYRLNPLNLYDDLPRKRMLVARFQCSF